MEYSKYSEWSEDEKNTFREWLRSQLNYGPVTVSFKKKDGTIRDMNCTLKIDLVKDYEKKTDRQKAVNENVCPVFDIDKQEWRSFRYDTITEVRFTIE